jgi:hypothetical protein
MIEVKKSWAMLLFLKSEKESSKIKPYKKAQQLCRKKKFTSKIGYC